MKEIKIDGLTIEQYSMLNEMWELKTTDEFAEWMGSLSAEKVQMVMVLKELLIAHVLDEINDISFVKTYLKKYRL